MNSTKMFSNHIFFPNLYICRLYDRTVVFLIALKLLVVITPGYFDRTLRNPKLSKFFVMNVGWFCKLCACARFERVKTGNQQTPDWLRQKVWFSLRTSPINRHFANYFVKIFHEIKWAFLTGYISKESFVKSTNTG